MNEILIVLAATFAVFLCFGLALGFAIVKQKTWHIVSAIVTFLMLVGGVGYTVYLVGSKTMARASNTFEQAAETMKEAARANKEAAAHYEPRSGMQIYDYVFDPPTSDCVTIINSQDENTYEYDYTTWLHVETCPEEIDRILAGSVFNIDYQVTEGWTTVGPNEENSWFTPELLGDKIYVLTSSSDYGDEITLYVNLEKTEMFYTGAVY